MADRLIRITTALAAIVVAAVISYRHAYELVRAHGKSGATARLVPFAVDGLIWAASMVILDAGRRNHRVPALAKDSTFTKVEQTPEDAVLADYIVSLDGPGRPLSQQFLAEKHGVDRRKVKQIVSEVAQPDPVRDNRTPNRPPLSR